MKQNITEIIRIQLNSTHRYQNKTINDYRVFSEQIKQYQIPHNHLHRQNDITTTFSYKIEQLLASLLISSQDI